MIARLPNIERPRADTRHPAPPAPHDRTGLRGLAEFVPSDSAVLWLGTSGEEAARVLEGRCVQIDAVNLDETPVDVAGLGRFEFGRARFDVVIADDVVGRVAHPEALLDSLRRALRAGGRLIATVPNAAHPAVLSAISRGEPFYHPDGPIDEGQLRLFSATSFVEAIESADFLVGRIEGLPGPAGPDAATWLAVAHPLPVPGLERLKDQFREISLEREEAHRTAETLRSMLTLTRRALDAAHLRADTLAAANRKALSANVSLQADIAERDRAYAASLAEYHAQVEEIEPLRAGRDGAHRHALAAEARCRSLELRIEHILMEIPRRFARKLRSAIARKRPNTPSGGTR